MEILFSIENYEEGGGNYREINSPRSLEACLRCGLDPAELYPKPRSFFVSRDLTKEMIDIKCEAFEKKRQGSNNISGVNTSRAIILHYPHCTPHCIIFLRY